jgi:acetylornithine deacetylase/succinyl-diaminopimelate desuccinylase-like protein
MLLAGGVCFGTWPGRASVGIEIRTVPGMDRDEVRAAVADLVARTVGDQATATVRYVDGSLGWMPATELDPGHPVVVAANEAVADVLGHRLPLGAYPGGTDAAYFMGERGIATVVSLGPGWLSVAHGANEKVGVSQLYDAENIYARLIERYLAQP